jgi:hypothetical protein
MVAVIKIKDALVTNFYYNENKVIEGVAQCLMAENYPADMERLSQAQRIGYLQKLAALHEEINVNSVHISLNFDPSEDLSQDLLKELAASYMDRIGFGQQPYLVYQHFDAGHPHIHILSVKVGLDGKGIPTHLIAVKKSEPARKELEEKYGLVRAEDMARQDYKLKPAFAQKVQYGKTESRRAIANVLGGVLMQYKYTSIAELNAVLQQYNVLADRCKETSRVYKNNGLLYRILDENGKPVGVPIKASAFHNKPTLTFLEERFQLNENGRQPLKRRVKNIIDHYFINRPRPSMDGLLAALKKEGIHTTLRQNEQGFLYGITYVDHKNKVVFNGSDLGKPYSAKAIEERCRPLPAAAGTSIASTAKQMDGKEVPASPDTQAGAAMDTPSDTSLLEILMQPEQVYDPLPYQLKKTRKKKYRRTRK